MLDKKHINLWRYFRGLLILALINYLNLALAEDSKANSPPNTGNFALAPAQQPIPFFSFGQNIVDKNQLSISYNPSYLYSRTQQIIQGTPSVLYGLTNSASVLITIPYALSYTNGHQNLAGMGDVAVDWEYAFFNHENSYYSEQATVIFSNTFPIGTAKGNRQKDLSMRISGFSRKNAPSSLDAFSYFVGATYARTLTDWYGYIAPGALFIDKKNSIQLGTQYYYNLGIGHHINSVEQQYLVFGLVEISGQYSDKTQLASHTVPNTGGSIVYATPSLWFSTPKFGVQIGISLPLIQSWYGNQSNISYYASSILTWTIN